MGSPELPQEFDVSGIPTQESPDGDFDVTMSWPAGKISPLVELPASEEGTQQ